MLLKRIIEKHGKYPENLLHILLEYQSSKNDNCITEDDVAVVADELGISRGRVYSIVTFYSLFSTKKRGRYVIQVCDDVPCYINGSAEIIGELENMLKIKIGETTDDGVFTLEKTSCIGCCDKPPALRIGEDLYVGLTVDKVSEIITLYRRKYNESRE